MMSDLVYPDGWHPSSFERRFITAVSTSLDESTRSVNAVLSTGAAVQRFYGTEILAISREAIDTTRVLKGLCPLLDSHQSGGIASMLGRVAETWIKSGNLWGKLAFGETPQGDAALGMVRRNEISGISVGYRVAEWSVRDSDGELIDQELSYSNAASFTYCAERWELLEASLTSVAADAGAGVRAQSGSDYLVDVRARMNARQRMHERMAFFNQ
jgi:hypothetical protein